MVLAALVGVTAGCGGSSSSSSSSTGPVTTSSASRPSASATTSAPFADIVEPFDPGHAAQVRGAPVSCVGQSTTLAIELCYEIKTENTDVQIDAAQQAAYSRGSAAQRAAILAQDRAWLAARGPVCRAAFRTGGTVDGISVAACLLEESTARLAAVEGITPPEARLKATDSIDPNQLSWYTTPEGSRIAEISTQGDQTGGAIIAWVIVGGADGFVINPRQFYFSDGSFTDYGIIQGPDPAFHRVDAGVRYEFDIDYSHLSAAPAGGTQGFVYVPGAPVAIWQ